MVKLTKDPLLCVIRHWWWQMPQRCISGPWWTRSLLKLCLKLEQGGPRWGWGVIWSSGKKRGKPINGRSSNRPLWLPSCLPPIVFCPPSPQSPCLRLGAPHTRPPPAISLHPDSVQQQQAGGFVGRLASNQIIGGAFLRKFSFKGSIIMIMINSPSLSDRYLDGD